MRNSKSLSANFVITGLDAAVAIMTTLLGTVTDCAASVVEPEVSGPTIALTLLLFTSLVAASTASAGVA